MTEGAIECRGLTKRIGRKPILRGIDLVVERGEVFGLLGPNGAGKTTTIRTLLGLSRISEGSARIFGEVVPLPADKQSRVGAMVEDPAFYPWLSGRKNLAVLLHKAENDPDLDAAMERTGILDAAGRRVKTYSHGMRQRLGLALALCGHRDVLILDEPANGLDPSGVRDIRSLLREAASQGTAVFISSHQLSEVERACDRAAILVGGRVVEAGTISELGGDEGAVQVQVGAEQRERALAILGPQGARLERDGTIVISGISGHEVSRLLGEAGVYPDSVSQLRSSLEERFLSVTEGSVDASTRR